MDQALSQLLHKETIYLALLVVIGTFFVRRIVETAAPSVKGTVNDGHGSTTYSTKFGLWWNSVILYAIPVLLGAGLAMISFKGGYLPSDIKHLGGAGMWGCIIGWFSSFLYKVFRKVMKQKTGVDPTPGPASVLSAPAEDDEPESEDEPEVDEDADTDDKADDDEPDKE